MNLSKTECLYSYLITKVIYLQLTQLFIHMERNTEQCRAFCTTIIAVAPCCNSLQQAGHFLPFPALKWFHSRSKLNKNYPCPLNPTLEYFHTIRNKLKCILRCFHLLKLLSILSLYILNIYLLFVDSGRGILLNIYTGLEPNII